MKYFYFVLVMAGASYSAESDKRVVQSEFDRCVGIMERVDRSIERFRDAITDLKRIADAASPEKRESLTREITPLESKLENFRCRLDRSTGQAEKTRCELKSNGGRCSSCLLSSVNMNCRNAETMLTDLDDQIVKAAQLQSRWRSVSSKVAADRQTGAMDVGGEVAKTGEKPWEPWRVSAGVDYYHLQDVDTVAMTPEQLQDYQRLKKIPLTAYTRVSFEARPSAAGVLEKITPEIYLSSYKGRIEVPGRLRIGGDRFSLTPAITAEKWFDSTAADRESFDPAKKQPSDMGGASLRFEQSSSLIRGALWSFTAPLFLDWEHYRADKPGYESFVEGRMTPGVDLHYGEKIPLSTRLTGEIRYEDYYRKESDSLSVTRYFVRMDNDFISQAGLTLNLSAQWQGDRYSKRHVPADIDRWEGGFRFGYVVCKWLEPRLHVRGIHERERYASIDSFTAYAIPGSDASVRPSARFRVSQAFTIEPEMSWRQRWAQRYPEFRAPYLWQAYSSWEPGIRGEFSSSRVEFSVLTTYRTEDVGDDFEAYVSDSRAIKVSGDGGIQLGKALSISLLADYQYRMYKPYSSAGRKTENLSLSGQMTMKW